MNLYRINVIHYSQKDSHTAIETFLTALDDEAVYEWLSQYQGGIWNERNEDDGLIDIYNDEFDVIGQETYKEKMIRIKGEFYDEDLEICDRYYGVTLYGWEQVASSPVIVEALHDLDLLIEL
jgi:N12 class adenine-specific DNA methylase